MNSKLNLTKSTTVWACIAGNPRAIQSYPTPNVTTNHVTAYNLNYIYQNYKIVLYAIYFFDWFLHDFLCNHEDF